MRAEAGDHASADQLNVEQIDFLQTVAPPALAQQRDFGIPAAITIAQACLESGWGESSLVAEANNPFGIQWFKGTNRDPLPPVQKDSWEVINGRNVAKTELFRHFPNLMDAFTARALLLMGQRYRTAYAERGNWQKFAALLGPKTAENPSGCGYSTEPKYAAILTQLVKEFRLDDPRALERYAEGKDPGPQIAQNIKIEGDGK